MNITCTGNCSVLVPSGAGADGAAISIGLFLLLGFIVLFALPFLMPKFVGKPQKKRTMTDMANDNIARMVILFAASAYYLINGVMFSWSTTFELGAEGTLTTIFSLLGYFFIAFIIYLIIAIIYDMLSFFKQKKLEREFGGPAMDEGDEETRMF